MKAIAILFIIAATAMVASAQTSGPDHAPPNVKILSQKWSKTVIVQVTDRPDYDVIPAPSRSSPPPSQTRTLQSTRYVYEAKVRNTGDKDIRAMRWDYVFIDAETEVDRRRFYSTVTIHPNHEKTLEGYTRSAPTATVSATACRLSEWSSSASLFQMAQHGDYLPSKEAAVPLSHPGLRRIDP
jgi:hypothetical protein